MALFNSGCFPSQGWRRAGIFNVAIALSLGLLLLVLLCISLSRQEGHSLMGTSQVYRGVCKDMARLSTVLHLALNIVSTGILASSNFFMQIVTSPSRPEIDRAHAYLRSLDIGVQSLRNISSLSYFKRILWLLLLLSSIPIHLFFNSAIYETRYQSETFNLAIATNHFIDGGEYWFPGASLSPSGSSSPVQELDGFYPSYFSPMPPGEELEATGYRRKNLQITGFGDRIYFERYTAMFRNGTYPDGISSYTALVIDKAARNGREWEHLDAQRCMAEYRTAEPRTDFTNVIIVARTGLPEPNGWKRVDVYELDSDHDPNASNLSSIWNATIPPTQVNSLWSWNQCSVGERRAAGTASKTEQYNSCGRLLGLGSEVPDWDTIPKAVKAISFGDDGMNGTTDSFEAERGYTRKLKTLQIDHCRAERVKSCQVRVANVLLLVVVICVMAKVAICIVLMRYLKTTSLVTPGDAIESFISTPDPVTRGLATLSMHDVQALEFSRRQHYERVEDPVLFQPPARRWQGGFTRLTSAASRGVWVQVYYPALLALSALLVGVIYALRAENSGMSAAKFGPNARNKNVLDIEMFGTEPSFVGILLVTNSPQLIFSICYLAINSLFTQLQVEREWNSYARSYRPLRVSYPVGDQISTYRLQLPYKYSVPLIITSTVMHWLLSSSIYLLIIEGDSGFEEIITTLQGYLGVSSDAAVAIGYSSLSVLITFVVGCLFILTPLFFRRRKLQGEMVLGGTNSLVLSAACHIPVRLRHSAQDSETLDSDVPDAAAYLQDVSRGEVRWGAMTLPPDAIQQLDESGTMECREPIMHLGFAGRDHAVETPRKGQLYI